MPLKNLYMVDLFAGCGGLSLGMEQAGFLPVFVNELNADALRTYIVNRVQINPLLRDPAFHINDVKEMVLDPRYIPNLKRRLRTKFGIHSGEIDLLVGGPPCQGYSGIGHRRSYSVDKEQLPSNVLYQDMAAVVHRLNPRIFVFENVRGLMFAKWNASGRKGEIWEHVQETFESLKDYRTAFSLVYAKDYGVPQNRPRILLVGLHKSVRVSGETSEKDAVKRGFLPRPSGERPPGLHDLLGDLVDPNYQNGSATTRYPGAAITPIQKALRCAREGDQVAPKGAQLLEQQYSKHGPRIVAKFKAMHQSGGAVPAEFMTKKFSQRLLKPDWGEDGPSITATSMPDDYVHFHDPRTLTVREWARLQLFPDWYQFSGKRTTGGIGRAGNPREGLFDREAPKYTQIGNAVPVGLAKRVGVHLAKILRN